MTYEQKVSAMRALGEVHERDFYPERPGHQPPYRHAQLRILCVQDELPEQVQRLAELVLAIDCYASIMRIGQSYELSASASRPLETFELRAAS